jgi:hypothetical protein
MTAVTAGPRAQARDDGAPPVLLSREGDVVTLTLNNPRRKNAMSHPAWLLLRDSLAAVAGSDARVLVVTGAAGDFSAGADLSVESGARPPMANMAEVNQACLALHRLPVPTIARVDGVAVGALANRLLAGPQVALTGLTDALYPTDPEPEYVDINRDRIAAVTLQENNAIALVDLDTLAVVDSFSAGTVVRADADIADDEGIAFDDALEAPREPDAIQSTPDGNLLTADEGDLVPEPSGGRGWTVFSPDGDIVFTAGGEAEQALAGADRYPDGRSDDKGAEFEGAEVADLRGGSYAFIGSERGDAVLVYRFEDESAPVLVQLLETGDAPEGLLAVTRQQLFLTSNEDDGTISVFQLGR